MAKRKMSRTEQILLVVAIVVIGTYFFLGKVHDPLLKQHKTSVKKHNKVVGDLNKLKNEPVNTEMIQRSISKTKPEVQNLEWKYRELAAAHLASQDHVEETVMSVNALAGDNGLIVEEFKPVAEKEAGLFSGIAHERKLLERSCYRMRISGDFMDFFRFLRELSGLTPLANPTGLHIESADEAGRVKVSLVVLI